MKRRWKILIGFVVALAILLGLNTIAVTNQTKSAEVTVDGGQILQLSGGEVQVADTGPPTAVGVTEGQTIVLIHPYPGSLHWFDRITPILAERHRVIRIDLLGFGGSEKPTTGYAIDDQAALVAEALAQLEVEGALVAGNSLGASVTAALAQRASQLVDRAVVIDQAPNESSYGGSQSLPEALLYAPVIGPAVWRLTPDFAIRDAMQQAFAPGFDVAEGFDNPNQVVIDYRAMTFTSFDQTSNAADEFVEAEPLDQRFTAAAVPLLVIFGAEDQIYDVDDAIAGYAGVPGVETELVADAGHAPQVEQPQAVADLIEAFSF